MLSVSDLTLGYSGKPVLKMQKLHLPPGGQCVISGASGSGKTSLIYAIAGLLPPITGNISINNTAITGMDETARDAFRGKHIGIIFQTLHLVKSLTVMDNLLLSSYVAGLKQDARRALEVLGILGLTDKQDALPQALSQGQAQRVAIARAVLHRPALILADEPTSSLDDANCSQVVSLIQQVAKETGAMLVISTHDNRVKPHFSNVISLGDAA